MPTYRNDTEHRITHAHKTYIAWDPGEAKSLPYFVPYRELGLTLVDSEPKVCGNTSLYLYEELVLAAGDAPTVVELPYHEEFELSLICPRGVVLVQVGDGDERLVLDVANQHQSRYAWDMTAYLTFEALEVPSACGCESCAEKTAYVQIKMEASRFAGGGRV